MLLRLPRHDIKTGGEDTCGKQYWHMAVTLRVPEGFEPTFRGGG